MVDFGHCTEIHLFLLRLYLAVFRYYYGSRSLSTLSTLPLRSAMAYSSTYTLSIAWLVAWCPISAQWLYDEPKHNLTAQIFGIHPYLCGNCQKVCWQRIVFMSDLLTQASKRCLNNCFTFVNPSPDLAQLWFPRDPIFSLCVVFHDAGEIEVAAGATNQSEGVAQDHEGWSIAGFGQGGSQGGIVLLEQFIIYEDRV
jgi:hypothetical protein